jgi:hypothetical protein
MTIRRSHIEIVDFGEGDYIDDNDDTKKSYCKHCLEYGFKVPLKNRIYQNEPIPVDHDQWRQCHECGLIVPVYELQKESEIKDVVETVENPFDIAKNEFLGIDSRASAKKRKTQRDKQKELDDIKDPDLKRELGGAQTHLISYVQY